MGRISDFRASLDWPKMIGETIIIVVGVFLGIQASNWNEERLERAETKEVLRSLNSELSNMIENFQTLVDYYKVTRNYATTAFAGWNGDPAISDRDFVIAAYQASQNTFTGINSGSWSTVFGSDRLRNIEDEGIREDLAALMTQDYNSLEKELFTAYRQNVRKVIPEDIQDAIRSKCGDVITGTIGYISLPATCTLDLPEQRFVVAAAALRDHPELVGELRWHFAAVASYVYNLDNLRNISKRLLARIERV